MRSELQEVKHLLDVEDIYISQFLTEIENRLTTNSLTCFAQDMTTTFPNPAQDEGDTSLRAVIDYDSNVVTLPYKTEAVPKTFINDLNHQAFVPNKINLKVNGQSLLFYQNDPRKMLSPDDDCWFRYVKRSVTESQTSETVTIEVELPPQLITSYDVNTIRFRPHPPFGLKTTNLEYQYRGDWTPVPGFQPVDRLRDIAWHFPTIKGARFRLTLEQARPFINGTEKVFVIGSKFLGIYYQEYADQGIVLSSFKVTPPVTVEKVTHHFANASCFNPYLPDGYDRPQDFFVFALCREEPDGTLTYLSNWSNLPYDKLWVITTLKKTAAGTPALTRVTLTLR
ncbi:virion structural protein [Moorella phage MTATph1]